MMGMQGDQCSVALYEPGTHSADHVFHALPLPSPYTAACGGWLG